MPRNPDMPCAVCGQLMWRGGTSLPEGQATCRPCRRKAAAQTYGDEDLSDPVVRNRVRARNRYRLRVGIPINTPLNPFVPEWRECRICNTLFETRRPNQVYCSAECRNSRTNWSYAKQMSTSERGYGVEHQRERRRWKKIVDAGDTTCCICGYWIEPDSAWHLDHTPDRTGYRGAAHASCNRRDGARRGNQAMPRPQIDKVCAGCQQAFTTIYPRQRYCSRECK